MTKDRLLGLLTLSGMVAISGGLLAQSDGAPTAGEYQAVIASRGQEPEGARLDQLIALYLRDRQISNDGAAVPPAQRERAELAATAAQSINSADLPSSARLAYQVVLSLASSNARIATATPNTREWYAAVVGASTGLTPDDIYEAGLVEIRRLHQEVIMVGQSAGLKGSYGEIVAAVQRDPKCAPIPAEAVIPRFQALARSVEASLPGLFKTIPTTPYAVVTASIDTVPSGGMSQTGRVTLAAPFPNACAFTSVALHEGVLGHQLETRVAAESHSILPIAGAGGFRRIIVSEGWAQYASSLADELGIRLDPYERVQRLAGETGFAVRAVIETGVRWHGWSREQAKAFFTLHAPWVRPQAIDAALDQVSQSPGGGLLAYTVGKRRIEHLRAYAEGTLGARFDVRAFHDEVVKNWAIPIDVLDARIRDWVTAQK